MQHLIEQTWNKSVLHDCGQDLVTVNWSLETQVSGFGALQYKMAAIILYKIVLQSQISAGHISLDKLMGSDQTLFN